MICTSVQKLKWVYVSIVQFTHKQSNTSSWSAQTSILKLHFRSARDFPLVTKYLETLDPSVVKAKSVATLAPLLASLPSLVNDDIVQKIDSEWRMLRNSVTTCFSKDSETTPVKFWIKVRGMTSGDRTPVFPFLAEFMIRLLCLPHSRAAAGRVFSAVNRMKTKTRNRLSTNTIAGLLHTRRLMAESKW